MLIGESLTPDEKNEFKNAHLEQTKRLIKGECSGSLKKSLEDIEILKVKQLSQKNNNSSLSASSLFEMVSDCCSYGTVPFSILARHAFIAKTLLLSLVMGILSEEEIDRFQLTITTVAGELVDDMQSLQLGGFLV